MNANFFKTIGIIQNLMIAISIVILMAIPAISITKPEIISGYIPMLFDISTISVFLVMSIRPIADLFPQIPWIRPLVILRKGFGIFSASIVVAFILPKIGLDGLNYFSRYTQLDYWVLPNAFTLAHFADATAIILLVTSNKFSRRILGNGWKVVQKLAYVYFFAGASYHVFVNNQVFPIYFMIIVFLLTLFAFVKNRQKLTQQYAN